MKPIKLGTLALTAALALGAYSTKAVVAVTVNYSKLNVSGTIITNCPTIWKNDVEKYTTKTAKFGNKQLLDLFAHWDSADRTIQPWKSAQLVIGWDWDYDVLVVDKTGTNVLFDASAGYHYAYDYYFYVDFFDAYGAGTETYVAADPGSETVKSFNSAYFELYDVYYYLPYTDLSAEGGSTQSFKQTWDVNDDPLKWSDTETANFLYSGDNYFLDVGMRTTVSGRISTSGHGKDYNYIGWAD